MKRVSYSMMNEGGAAEIDPRVGASAHEPLFDRNRHRERIDKGLIVDAVFVCKRRSCTTCFGDRPRLNWA